MGSHGTVERAARLARFGAVALSCLALANCSSGSSTGRYSAKLGVKGSPRVVEPGQPVPKGGGVYSVGKPYTIAGRTYYPAEDRSYKAEGLASWYGEDFHGRLTANREVYDMTAISAAHATMPLPSYARVTNLNNGRSMVVRVNDRGPYHPNRIIDLSERGAELLGFKQAGTTKVRVEYVGRAPLEGSDDRQLLATLRDDGDPAPAPASTRIAQPRLEPFGGSPFEARQPSPSRRVATSVMPQSRADAPTMRDDAPAYDPPPRRTRTTHALIAEPSDLSSSVDDEAPSAPRLAAPVGAPAAPRYDGTQSLATGRGLY